MFFHSQKLHAILEVRVRSEYVFQSLFARARAHAPGKLHVRVQEYEIPTARLVSQIYRKIQNTEHESPSLHDNSNHQQTTGTVFPKLYLMACRQKKGGCLLLTCGRRSLAMTTPVFRMSCAMYVLLPPGAADMSSTRSP